MTNIPENLEDIQARRLGVALSTLLAIAAWTLLLQEKSGAFFFSLCATLLLTISLLKPSLLKIPSLLWFGFLGILSGWIIRGLLLLGYFLVLTPVGLILRILGLGLFSEGIDRPPHSHWTAPRNQDSYRQPPQKTNLHTMRW